MNLIEQIRNRKLLSLSVEVAYPSKEEPLLKLKVKRPPAVELNEITDRARRVVSSFKLDSKDHSAEFLEEVCNEYFKLCEKYIEGWESDEALEYSPTNKKAFFDIIVNEFKSKQLGLLFRLALMEDENSAGKKSQTDTAKPVASE